MLETELKCMLTEAVYGRLKDEFVWDSAYEQVNSYYSDSRGELRKNGITLRVRTRGGKNVIQVKIHKNAGSPLQISEEREFAANGIPQGFSTGEVKRMTGIETEVTLLGSLTTLRRSLMYCDGVEICLDKNDYLDRTDYEIEIEYTKEPPAELMERLKAAGAEFNEPASGKCSRFMIRLANIIHGEE